MKKLALALFVIVLAAMAGAPMVSAQEPASKAEVQAKLQKMATELQLTPEQKEKIKPILMEEAPKIQAVKNDTSLAPAQKMMQMRQIREATDAKINPILTPDQQQKLQAMRAQHRDEMMQKMEKPQ